MGKNNKIWQKDNHVKSAHLHLLCPIHGSFPDLHAPLTGYNQFGQSCGTLQPQDASCQTGRAKLVHVGDSLDVPCAGLVLQYFPVTLAQVLTRCYCSGQGRAGQGRAGQGRAGRGSEPNIARALMALMRVSCFTTPPWSAILTIISLKPSASKIRCLFSWQKAKLPAVCSALLFTSSAPPRMSSYTAHTHLLLPSPCCHALT